MTTLLKSEPTPLELASDQTSAAARSVPFELLKTISDPYECPEVFLPFLAALNSVDIWYDHWPVGKKRYATAMAKSHHRYKGSEWTMGEYLRLVGAQMLEYKTAPQAFYEVSGWTDEERAQYLAQLSQIRIHRHYPVDIEADGFFEGVDFEDVDFYGSGAAWHGYRKHAQLVRPDGSTQDLTVERYDEVSQDGIAVEVERIILPAAPDAGFYDGVDFNDVDFLGNDDPRERIVETTTEGPYRISYGRGTFATVLPRGQRIDSEPDLIIEPGAPDCCGFFEGIDFDGVDFEMPDDGWQSIYERYYLHDPNVISTPIETGGSYNNVDYFDWPPFRILVTARLTGYQPAIGADEFEDGFYLPPELDDYNAMIDAADAAKSEFDQVLLNTQTYRWPRFSDRLSLVDGWPLHEMIKEF